MKVFVKYYSFGTNDKDYHKIFVNQWCEIKKLDDEGDYIRPYRVVSGYDKVYLDRKEFLTVSQFRKQKIKRLCLEQEIK